MAKSGLTGRGPVVAFLHRVVGPNHDTAENCIRCQEQFHRKIIEHYVARVVLKAIFQSQFTIMVCSKVGHRTESSSVILTIANCTS